jgi:hypothetical protein
MPVLQTIRLASWSGDPARALGANGERYEDVAFYDPAFAEEVVKAVSVVNAAVPKPNGGGDGAATVPIGNYKLLAASPNWLGMPFQ